LENEDKRSEGLEDLKAQVGHTPVWDRVLAGTPEIIDEISMVCPEALLADGFDDALIGYAWGTPSGGCGVAVYDRDKCIAILMSRDGMTYEDAEEFFDFNVEGAYVGPMTPIFVSVLRRVR
jgi:hypothetical protein